MSVLLLGGEVVACGRAGIACVLRAHRTRTGTCGGSRPRPRRDIRLSDGGVGALRCRRVCGYSGAQPPHSLAREADRFDSGGRYRCGLSLGLTPPVGAVGAIAAMVRINDRCQPVHFWWGGELMPEALPADTASVLSSRSLRWSFVKSASLDRYWRRNWHVVRYQNSPQPIRIVGDDAGHAHA
jgi:hypothetical protein